MTSELFLKGTCDDTLYASFGGIDLYDGKLEFQFQKTLRQLVPKYDKYFLIDKEQCWYHSGISGITSNIPETVEYLREKSSKYDNVYFIGNSAGGYAAILFGSLLNVTKVLAFQPQTDISLVSGVECSERLDVNYIDIKPYINSVTQYILYGNYNAPAGNMHHILHCRRISDVSNVSLTRLPEVNLRKMRDEGILKQIILSL